MCGVGGYVGQTKYPEICLKEMVNAINHRGPDNTGIWADSNIGLGHARLSIIDLSSAGHQPMHSVSRNFVMIFNGEIYNHNEIRMELNSLHERKWTGHSDTETLLEAIEQWGLETTLNKTKGMFSIALWDKRNRNLYLSRDRMGEKPLYYGWVDNQFVFASELKAIKKFPKFNNSIDRNALALFLRFNSIPSPYSIYEDIFKLEPGTIIQFNADSKKIVKSTYWSTEEEIIKSSSSAFSGNFEDAVNQLELILSKAVSSQMESDVPLGAFLSGGVDSSLIVALMQSQSGQKVNTFSIGFNNVDFNEAEHASMVAKHLGTNHSELYVNESDAIDVIPNLPYIYDEPFADSSQIPTYIVSRFAKQNVSVALSGDGGDEVFGGYNRYVYAERMFSRIQKIPVSLKRIISKAILSISEEKLEKILGVFTSRSYANIGDKLYKAAHILSAESVHDSHFKLVSQIHNPENWLLNSNEYKTIFNDDISRFKGLNSVEKMMANDLVTYLPTDILTKVDRAAMAVSLETRIPFLDPDVIKFSASLPINYKIKNGVTKLILREILYKHVKKDLIERPKMGFAVPLADWLRGPLQDWAESLLDENRMNKEGFFNVKLVRRKWHEHICNKRNWHHQLWNVLMFQSWLERN